MPWVLHPYNGADCVPILLGNPQILAQILADMFQDMQDLASKWCCHVPWAFLLLIFSTCELTSVRVSEVFLWHLTSKSPRLISYFLNSLLPVTLLSLMATFQQWWESELLPSCNFAISVAFASSHRGRREHVWCFHSPLTASDSKHYVSLYSHLGSWARASHMTPS